MKYAASRLVLAFVLSCVAMCLSAAQEQRVLLSFDNAGHQVSKIVRPDMDQSSLREEKIRPKENHQRPDFDLLASQLRPGFALLVWLDDEGYAHARTQEPDPRISHAPAHISGVHGSRLGTASGAWLVSGPVSATGVRIFLASNPALDLAAEQWQVSLEDR